jgi:hypothetical protein
MTDTRDIRPHKGGRTAHAPRARMTPEARAQLDALLKRTGESMADWIERHVDEETQQTDENSQE